MSKFALSVAVALIYTFDEDINDQGDIVTVVSLDRFETIAAFEHAMDVAEDNRLNSENRLRGAIIEAFRAFDNKSSPKDAVCMAAANYLTIQSGGSTADLIAFNKQVSEYISENSISDEEGLDVSQAFLVSQKKSGISLVTPEFLTKRAETAAEKAKAATRKAAKSATKG